MKTKTHFAFRVDVWDETGDSIVEYVAGVDDFEVAEATYRAPVARWPAARITLRQGARLVHKSGQQTNAALQIGKQGNDRLSGEVDPPLDGHKIEIGSMVALRCKRGEPHPSHLVHLAESVLVIHRREQSLRLCQRDPSPLSNV
jgi:hypothetical protein